MRFCTLRGKAARRLAHPAAEAGRSPTRETPARGRRRATSSAVRLLATMNSAMSPTALRRRRDLDDVAEQLIDLGVHPADFRPAVGQAQRLRLLIQVRVLPAGHLVAVEVGRRRRACRFRTARRTRGPPPSSRQCVCSCSASRPVSRSVNRSASTSAFRFGCAGAARHRRPSRRRRCRAPPRPPSRIDAGLHAGRVVRVEVDRNADLLLERLDQQLGRVRLAQAGHVLDGQDVRAHLLQLLGQLDVVLQVVLRRASGRGCRPCSRWPLRRCAPVFEHGVHRHPHVRHPVERVEDAEDVHARLRPLPCTNSWTTLSG